MNRCEITRGGNVKHLFGLQPRISCENVTKWFIPSDVNDVYIIRNNGKANADNPKVTCPAGYHVTGCFAHSA